MSERNITPQEFLRQTKAKESSPFPRRTPSPEFLRIHIEQTKSADCSTVNPEEFFDEFFTSILKDLIELLDSPLKEDAQRQLAIGCVDHAEANAYILRDGSQNCYAIVLNGALINLLNHYVKLIQASQHPESIVYSSEKLTERREFPPVMSKMLSDYIATGVPSGPELKIRIDSNAMKFVEVSLRFIYRFITAHELGHFIGGDLDSPKNFAVPMWNENVSVFSKNISHEMEFKADIIAFGLLLRLVAEEAPQFPAGMVFELSVKVLFNLFRELNDVGCSTHPPSSARMLVIAHHFFGEEAAIALRFSFDDLSYLTIFHNLIGGVTVSDLIQGDRGPIQIAN